MDEKNQDIKDSEEIFDVIEDPFQIIIENANEGFLIIDSTLNLLYCNKRTSFLIGYNCKELLGMNFKNLIHPDETEKVLDIFKNRFEEEEQPIRFETIFLSKDKRNIPIECSITEIVWKGVKTNLITISDITDRKTAEKALIDSQQLLDDILTASSVGISYSVERKIIWANEAMADLFGFTKEEQYKNVDTRLLYPSDEEYKRVGKITYEQLSTTGKVELDAKLHRLDGSIFDAHVRVNLLKPDEPRKGMIVSIIDITKRKQAEEKLKESEIKYRDAYNKSEFYKDLLAHDMGNILTNIMSSIQLLQFTREKAKDYEIKEKMLDLIKLQVERGASLISNIRKFSFLEEKEVSIKNINLYSLLDDAIDSIRSRFKKNNVEIKIDAPQQVLAAKAGDLLLDVFENILINAIIHNNSEIKKIWIEFSQIEYNKEKYVKIEFKDNAIGIVDERKTKIFERSYKKDKSTGGMGIGLSLVKMIIDGYEGKIWVENRIEGDLTKGSNFIILLKEV
ncbi:MAG: PAS domain S-box protein [Candidatus Hermodarchaeota archaeon]